MAGSFTLHRCDVKDIYLFFCNATDEEIGLRKIVNAVVENNVMKACHFTVPFWKKKRGKGDENFYVDLEQGLLTFICIPNFEPIKYYLHTKSDPFDHSHTEIILLSAIFSLILWEIYYERDVPSTVEWHLHSVESCLHINVPSFAGLREAFYAPWKKSLPCTEGGIIVITPRALV